MFEKIVQTVARWIVMASLFSMIAISFAQIVMRNFFASGLDWADVTVRHLVLWVGFFGATLATIEGRHISLDVFSRAIPERFKPHIGAVINLGSAAVCGVLAYASYNFVASERAFGSLLFAGVPVWIAQVVIPFTFGLNSVLFAIRGLNGAAKKVIARPTPSAGPKQSP